MRRSSQLRRVRFGQHITESQRFRPGFVITEHPDKYSLVSWYPRVVEHHRGDEGAVKAELAVRMHAEPRSSGTKINFRLRLRFFRLSLCGFRLCHNQANHNGGVKLFFPFRNPTQPCTAVSDST